MKVNVPAGVADGNYIPLRGQGNAGQRGGPPGDLIVMIEEEPHGVFTRHGEDVLLDLLVTIPEAILGAEVEVPTLTGRARLKIEAGTQSGRLLRMRGKGIPSLNGRGTGDQIVRVNVWIPAKLSKDEKNRVVSFSESASFKPPEGETSAHSDKSFFAKLINLFT
jgi:molecular chaperone DnaJ